MGQVRCCALDRDDGARAGRTVQPCDVHHLEGAAAGGDDLENEDLRVVELVSEAESLERRRAAGLRREVVCVVGPAGVGCDVEDAKGGESEDAADGIRWEDARLDRPGVQVLVGAPQAEIVQDDGRELMLFQDGVEKEGVLEAVHKHHV